MVGDIFISDGVRGNEGAGENVPRFTRFICLSSYFFLHNHSGERLPH